MEKQLAGEHGYYRKFTKDKLSDFKNSHNKETFFTPAEEGRLLHDILQSVPYEPVRCHSLYCIAHVHREGEELYTAIHPLYTYYISCNPLMKDYQCVPFDHTA